MTTGAYVIDKKTATKRTINTFIIRVQEQGGAICENMIQQDYIKHAVLEADYIVVVGKLLVRQLRSGTQAVDYKNITAFALIKRPSKSLLYIDLICGKGNGRMLFKTIDNLAMNLRVNQIKLSAIPSAMLRYYQAYDFKFSETCSENSVVSAHAIHALHKAELMKDALSRRSQAQTPRDKQLYQRRAIQASRALQQAMTELEEVLASMDIVHDKGCKTPQKCGIGGYAMTKCIVPT